MHCPQLKHLVLSADPSSFHELPDPFREGLQVGHLEEMCKAPKIEGDAIAIRLKAYVIVNLLCNSMAGEASVQQNFQPSGRLAYS